MTYKKFAIDIAKQAGKVIRANFKQGMKKDWKGNGTPVTKTDTAINKMVIAGVKKYFPDHDVLGEEESSLENHSKYLWVCDPVDGTIPFSHGIPTCVFSLALVVDGKPIVGVVYDALLDRMLYGEKNKGTFLNGKRVHVSKQTMDKAVLNWESPNSASLIKKNFPTSFPLSFCCVIYGGLLVATGEMVATLYTWGYAHDGASLKIIIEEAGGMVTDLAGKDQRYDGRINGFLASNGVVHKDLLKLIKQAGKKIKWF